jgi:hydrogenase expression/formation protein HypE
MEICSALRVDPLRLMSSGCLLIVADRRKSSGILRDLKKHGIPARIIGTMTPRRRGRKLVGFEGSAREVEPSERDELYRVIESYRAG